MRCSDGLLFWALTMAITGVAAADPELEAIIEQTRGIVAEVESAAEGEIGTFAAPVHEEEDWSWLQPREVPPMDGAVDEGSGQGRSWQTIETEAAAASEAGRVAPPHAEVPEDVMYVYFSLSMPAETIRSLFLEALDSDLGRSTVFVLRGWDVPGPNRLVARLNQLFPDADELGELPNVQINPVLYQQQDVGLVPTYSMRDDSGRWVSVVGLTTLADATERMRRGQDDGAVIGPTYEVEEPDILALIEERAANIDWEAEVARIRDGVLTRRTTGRALPHARRDASYLVDLTVVNNQDLAGPEGDVFAAAGQTVNPLDYMTMSRRYVFIDANSERHVHQALDWKANYAPVTVITTTPIQDPARRSEVMEQMGQQIFEINDLLIRRFQIREVPAIAYQEGRMLRVDVVGPAAHVAEGSWR